MNIKNHTYQIVDGVECKECNQCHRILPVTQFYHTHRDKYMSRCKECQSAYLAEWKRNGGGSRRKKKEEPELPCLYCKSYSYAGNSTRKSGYCIHHHRSIKADDTCGSWRPNTTLKFKL